MGRKAEAIKVWEKGHEHALNQSADLKQLLELEELLTYAKQDNGYTSDNQVESVSSVPLQNSAPQVDDGPNEPYWSMNSLRNGHIESNGILENKSKPHDNVDTFGSFTGDICQAQNRRLSFNINGSLTALDKSSLGKQKSSQLSLSLDESSTDSNSSGSSDISSKLADKSVINTEIIDKGKRSKKICVTKLSKSKAISVDFRLSRGIAEVILHLCFIWFHYFSKFYIFLQ